jgi:hypothetical protein
MSNSLAIRDLRPINLIESEQAYSGFVYVSKKNFV